MSPALRLGLFAAGICAVFGAAYGVGLAAGPQRAAVERAPASGGHGMSEMDDEQHGDAMPVRGLAVSEDGMTLRLERTAAPLGRTTELAFRISGPDGRTVRDFDVAHTKRMHLIIVRRDLSGFQHLHPEQQPDGSWRAPLEVNEAGSYRVFADFTRAGAPHTLAADLQVDGPYSAHDIPARVDSVEIDDGLTVTRRAEPAGTQGGTLAFEVTRGGRPVAIEDYLGAKGHLVALREGDLAFLHVHPDEDRLRFLAEFPSAGRYRLFLQFRSGGALHTAAFTEEVS